MISATVLVEEHAAARRSDICGKDAMRHMRHMQDTEDMRAVLYPNRWARSTRRAA
jgi:hypothetical protein